MSNHSAPVDESTGTSGDAQTETIEVPKDEYDELRGVKEELDSLKEDYQNYRAAMSKKLRNLKDELEEVREGGHSRQNPTGKSVEDGSNGDESTDDGGMLPIERLARIEDDDELADATMANVTASVERATTLFRHFGDWSSKAPKGRVIRDNLRNLLSTATGERLAWRQVYRACRKLEEWSKGAIEFVQHDRHGWILVDARGRSSSAPTG